MSIYKRGSIYWYKFTFNGEAIRESTRQRNQHTARQMEAAHRASLAKGEVGIRERKRVPMLSEFLAKDFVPYVNVKHAAKPGTVEYYTDGKKMLCNTDLGSLRLDDSASAAPSVVMAFAPLSRVRRPASLSSSRKFHTPTTIWVPRM
jgi:hypothetical protein